MNEVVKFLINAPVEVTLQSEVGTRVKGRYGEQVMYALADDRVMYVPPYVEQRFQELAIGVGEPLLLCKREVKEGSRNRIEWSVRRAPEQPPAPANGMIVPDGESAGETGNEMVREEEQPSGNSTAPMVRQSASTDNQYQRQDSAPASTTEIVHVPAATTRAVEFSSKDMRIPVKRIAFPLRCE